MLDVEAIRRRFPALARPVAYLDGPGGSQVPDVVIEAMARASGARVANDGGAFATSRQTADVVAAARAAAAVLTASAPEEIAFGPT
jgi:selenocysteine lyase/cysteine desulfurase